MSVRLCALLVVALVVSALGRPESVRAADAVTLVSSFATGAGSAWTPDSPDPSGLAYIPATETELPSQRRDRLVATDGEVEERTGAGWHNVNVWFAPRNGGTQSATMNTTTVNPTNKEPVGAAYDPARNELYISQDGTSGRIWVHNAATGALIRYFDVNVAPYFNADAEGLAFGNGALYMVDALDTNGTNTATNGNDLLKVLPGPDGVIGAKVTGNDDVVANYDLGVHGQREPEGLDVHPVTGNVWIVSNRVTSSGIPDPMIEVTPNGSLVSKVSIAAANPISPAGLAIAPASNGSGASNIYIVDRGVDNNDVPTENDGKVYEFSIGGGGGGTTEPDTTITGGPTGTVTSTDASFTFTGTSGTTSFECRLDGAAFTACTSPQAYSGLALGSHTFEVRALAGSTPDPTPATRTWTIEADEPPPTTGNLLLNPGFEVDSDGNGLPDSWSSNTKFTRSTATAPHGGTYTGRHFATNDSGYTVFQEVSVTAGTTYDVSGWVNVPPTSDAFTLNVRVRWMNGTTAISTTTIGSISAQTSGWQQLSGSLAAPSNATSARVMMVLSSLNATVYVDDFSLAAQ